MICGFCGRMLVHQAALPPGGGRLLCGDCFQRRFGRWPLPMHKTQAHSVLSGGWVPLPKNSTWILGPLLVVRDGEDFREVIARESGQVYVDSGTGESMTLGDLYAAAGADGTDVSTTNEAAGAVNPLRHGKRIN